MTSVSTIIFVGCFSHVVEFDACNTFKSMMEACFVTFPFNYTIQLGITYLCLERLTAPSDRSADKLHLFILISVFSQAKSHFPQREV